MQSSLVAADNVEDDPENADLLSDTEEGHSRFKRGKAARIFLSDDEEDGVEAIDSASDEEEHEEEKEFRGFFENEAELSGSEVRISISFIHVKGC